MGFRDWLRRVSGGAKRPTPDNTRIQELIARHRDAAEKAWWRDMTGLVAKTDQQLVVIKPSANATPDDLRNLGQALVRWRDAFPQARHLWGLTDLLQGQTPRTPPIYVAVPFSCERYEEAYEPVVLVYVTQGTDIQAAFQELSVRLNCLGNMLVCFDRPDVYSYYNR